MAEVSVRQVQKPIFEVLLVPVLTGTKRVEVIDWSLDERQRTNLAKRFELVCIDDFSFQLELSIGDLPHSLQLKGNFFSKIIQNCVLSLDRITTSIQKEIDLILLPDEADPLDILEGPDFEFYSGQTCDIGEIMAVELALSIDPYPRKILESSRKVGDSLTGVSFTNEEEYQAKTVQNINSPFLILDKLKKD